MRQLRRATRTLSGVGLHTGRAARVTICPPAPGSHDVVFRRTDLAGALVPVRIDLALLAPRRTSLCCAGISVWTVEHLLAALSGCLIEAAEVRLDGPEVPLLDGSAEPWVDVLLEASEPVDTPAQAPWSVTRRWCRSFAGGVCCTMAPHAGLRLECQIDYAHPAIGVQIRVFEGPDSGQFASEIAPARTFGLLSEAESLRRLGLARGATLDSVLVFGEQGPVNPAGLRFADEPVRHKLLDAIGDLALLGAPVQGAFCLDRCGHRSLLEALREAIADGVLRRNPSDEPRNPSDEL